MPLLPVSHSRIALSGAEDEVNQQVDVVRAGWPGAWMNREGQVWCENAQYS